MYPTTYVIFNQRPLKLSIKSLQTGKQKSPYHLHLLKQYYPPNQQYQYENQLRYTTLETTSKGDQGRNRVTTSKVASHQHPLIISKNTQVVANFKGDQEPIAPSTISRIASSANLLPFKSIQPLGKSVTERTRSSTLSPNYTTQSHSQALAAQLLTNVA